MDMDEKIEISKTKEKESEIIPITLKESNTYIYDGATLTCPLMVKTVSYMSHAPSEVVSGGIRLNVFDESVTYMNVFPMATADDNKIDNFTVINLEAKCMKTGKSCQIKPFVWSKVSERVFKNNKRVLNKQSEFSCMEDLGIRLKFASNGQQLSKFEGEINKFRKAINWTPDNPWVEQIFIGLIASASSYSLIMEGREMLKTGDTVIASAGMVTIAAGGIALAAGFREYFSAVESMRTGEKKDILKVFFSNSGFSEKEIEVAINSVEKVFFINDKMIVVLNIVKLKKEIKSEALKNMNRAQRKEQAKNLFGTTHLRDVNLKMDQIEKLIKIEKAEQSEMYLTAIKDGIKDQFVSKERFLEILGEKEIEYSVKKIDRLTGQERFDMNIKHAKNEGFISVK